MKVFEPSGESGLKVTAPIYSCQNFDYRNDMGANDSKNGKTCGDRFRTSVRSTAAGIEERPHPPTVPLPLSESRAVVVKTGQGDVQYGCDSAM